MAIWFLSWFGPTAGWNKGSGTQSAVSSEKCHRTQGGISGHRPGTIRPHRKVFASFSPAVAGRIPYEDFDFVPEIQHVRLSDGISITGNGRIGIQLKNTVERSRPVEETGAPGMIGERAGHGRRHFVAHRTTFGSSFRKRTPRTLPAQAESVDSSVPLIPF